MENNINNHEAIKSMGSFTDAFSKELIFNGITIQLNSRHSFNNNNFENLKEAVTGMQIGNDGQVADGYIDYMVNEDININYSEEHRRLTLAGPVHLFGRGNSIAYTAHYMAECLRSTKSGLMLVHSAAIKPSDREQSYVFLGEKGAGKTTLALRLCHQYSYELIGNDQVFMGANENDELITDSGNAWFNVRETAISADPYIAQLLGKPKNVDKPAWNNKVTVMPDSIGVSIYDKQLPVKEIFHVRIDHSQSSLRAMAWQGLQRNLILHERFGRHITGQATPFQDDYGNYLGSLPPINLKDALKARDKLVSLVIRSGVTEIFSPDSDSAVEYIHNRNN